MEVLSSGWFLNGTVKEQQDEFKYPRLWIIKKTNKKLYGINGLCAWAFESSLTVESFNNENNVGIKWFIRITFDLKQQTTGLFGWWWITPPRRYLNGHRFTWLWSELKWNYRTVGWLHHCFATASLKDTFKSFKCCLLLNDPIERSNNKPTVW